MRGEKGEWERKIEGKREEKRERRGRLLLERIKY